MSEDRAHDGRRVPNSAAPIVWQEGLQSADEPYRHVDMDDMRAAKEIQEKHKAESDAFERGEIKSANERL